MTETLSGKDFLSTDLQLADDLAILAINALVSAWTTSRQSMSISISFRQTYTLCST